MISPIEVAFLTACTALVSSFVSPFIAFKLGHAQIRASVVSINRQRWIETLRDLVSSFCAQVQVAVPIRKIILDENGIFISTNSEFIEKLEELMKTFTKVRLMISPGEADHRALVDILMKTLATLRTTPLDVDLEPRLDELVEEIVECSQLILKREWKRVKSGE